MIVKMKKMDLLLYHKEKEKFLEDLRKLGVVHITEAQVAESPKSQELRGVAHLSERVIKTLKKIQKERNLEPAQKAHGDPQETLHRFEDLAKKKEQLEQELAGLEKDKETLEPWGNFDPENLAKLEKQGVNIRFYSIPEKKFEGMDKEKYSITVVNRTDGTVYFVTVTRGEGLEVPKAEEVRLPSNSLEAVSEKIGKTKAELSDIDRSMEKLVDRIGILEKYRVEKLNQFNYEKARISMKGQVEGKLLSLSGWFPRDKEKQLRNYVGKYPAYVTTREPYADEDVPVKLKNRSFPTLFEPIVGMYSLPAYDELDVTPFMAPFFAIFFGLCLGDAGYGALLVITTLILRRKVSPKFKPFMLLGFFLALSTFVSGILLNTFFGVTIFGGPGVEGQTIFPTGVQFFAPLSAQEGAAGQIFPAMNLAIMLGVIQMLFGIGLQAFVKYKYKGFAAAMEPISTIVVLLGGFVWAAHINLLNLDIAEFTVGPVSIGPLLMSVPQRAGEGLAILGLIGILLFNNIEKKIFIRPLTGLWTLYNFATGTLQNLLSYLRLFALGLAGGLLGAAFNQVAFLPITTEAGEINYASWGIIATILILLAGHGLNLALSAMSAFVHPLRLTFVEFYGALDFRGGSKPFIPFSKIDQ
ncbi:MAG: V-type ATP synthase subunit I [Chitinispirillaceae bacterium]